MNISLEKITKDKRKVLENLMQLYLYDITRFLYFELNNSGLYEYNDLDKYFIDETCEPYFIKGDNKIIGFVLIDHDLLCIDSGYNVSEFFVLNSFRRKKIGAEIAFKIFNMHKCAWEVKPVPKSNEAFEFWKNVIEDYTKNDYTLSYPKSNRPSFNFCLK